VKVPRITDHWQQVRARAVLACALVCALPLMSWAAGEAVLVRVVKDTAEAPTSDTPLADQTVRILRGTESLIARDNLDLHAGDVIETPSGASALLRYSEGHEVLLTPSTRVKLGSIFVFFGEIIVRARGFFRVETTVLTAGVEGTQFLVRTTDSGQAVDVVVAEGAVVCKSTATEGWEPVRVVAAEQLTAVAAPKPNGGDPDVKFRTIRPSKVEKFRARGSDLSRIQQLSRQFGTY
jgi:hypothetical protein